MRIFVIEIGLLGQSLSFEVVKDRQLKKSLSRYSYMSSSYERSILVLFICLINSNLQNEWVNAHSRPHFIIKSSFMCKRRRRGACFTLFWLASLIIYVLFIASIHVLVFYLFFFFNGHINAIIDRILVQRFECVKLSL